MKFTCNQKDLHQNLSLVLGAISHSSSHPILSTVKIEVSTDFVKLSGFDLSIGIETTLPATVEEEGVVAISAKIFNDILSRLSGDVEIARTGSDGITITSASGKYSLAGMDASEYPELPTIEGNNYEILASTFSSAIAGCLVSYSRDESKQVLCGVYLKIDADSIECAATDGHRLTVRKTQNTLENDNSATKIEVVIPANALEKLSKILAATDDESILSLRIEDNQVVFISDNKVLTTRTVEGKYPQYNLLVPQVFQRKTTIDRKKLIETLGRVTVFSTPKDNSVIFIFNSHTDYINVIVNSQDAGHAHEDLNAQIEGTDIVVAFNAKYLTDGLKMLTTKEVSIEINGSFQPVVLREIDGIDVLYLAMPIQLTSLKDHELVVHN